MEANPYGLPQPMGQGMRQAQAMGPGAMQPPFAGAGGPAPMAHMQQVQGQMQPGHMGGGGMVGGVQGVPGGMPMGQGMGMGDYGLEELLGPFPCVRLRGLPFEATHDDVLRFFQGLVPLDVVMVVRNDGRGAGEALVVFPNHMELTMALSRDKQHMGRRYIEIFQAKRMDYYNAISTMLQMQGAPSHMGGAANMGGSMGGGNVGMTGELTGVLRMRGLPFSATKQDIISFFSGLNVLEDSIKFVVRGDGRVTGEAFVSMATPQDAEAAMSRNGNHMGSRYVELFPSSLEEANRHTSRHA